MFSRERIPRGAAAKNSINFKWVCLWTFFVVRLQQGTIRMDMPVTDDQNKCTSESTAGESQEKRRDYWRLKIESLQELIRAKDQTIRILEREGLSNSGS